MGGSSTHNLKAGDLILYPYLWGWQAEEGQLTGEKLRPAFVMHVSEKDQMVICGITTRFVKPPRLFIPIPEIECARGGLHDREFSKLVVSECNVDHVKNMWVSPVKMAGRFSPEFLMSLRRQFMAVLSKKKCMAVKREIALPQHDARNNAQTKEMSME